MESKLESLIQQAGLGGVQISEEQGEQFAAYHDLLEGYRAKANLTAVTGLEQVRDELFLRSLGVAVALEPGERTRLLGQGSRVLDVGSGGGFPGLPLAIAFPGASVTLLDSITKKTDFLEMAVESLALSNVDVVNGRAEELARVEAHRESYDLVVSRAVAGLPELAELTLPFCRVGGLCLALKGANVTAESASASEAAEQLGAAPAQLRSAKLGTRSEPDTAIVWVKVSPTPERFPRRTGIPHKRPLGVTRSPSKKASA